VELYRGAEYEISFVPKVKVEIVVSDALADKAIAVIGEKAKTGRIGDGKIFIYPITQALRIRTAEEGDAAL
jgi:nitrogen regulatory protein PII